METIDLIDYRL